MMLLATMASMASDGGGVLHATTNGSLTLCTGTYRYVRMLVVAIHAIGSSDTLTVLLVGMRHACLNRCIAVCIVAPSPATASHLPPPPPPPPPPALPPQSQFVLYQPSFDIPPPHAAAVSNTRHSSLRTAVQHSVRTRCLVAVRCLAKGSGRLHQPMTKTSASVCETPKFQDPSPIPCCLCISLVYSRSGTISSPSTLPAELQRISRSSTMPSIKDCRLF